MRGQAAACDQDIPHRRPTAGGERNRVATGGRVERGSRPRARTAEAAAPLPRRVQGERLDFARFVPSGRSLGIAFLIALGALGAWVGARETSVFAVRTVDVGGANPALAGQVRKALAPARGMSLLKVDLAESLQTVEAIPTVESARFDRAFPHTLRVVVVPERGVAIVRQGADSYLVAESGRVMDTADRHDRPALARIWVDRTVKLLVGEPTTGDLRTAVAAVAPLLGSHFPGRVSSVTATADALTLRLRSGLEIRLGDALDVPLKLAVAARVIPLLDDSTAYLDVAVPERPVSGSLNSQVEVDGTPSTTP
jgi:cell division protein FtsQ